jgi:hypothetical protein
VPSSGILDSSHRAAAGRYPSDQERKCFGCDWGVGYIGHMVSNEEIGEEEEVYEAVRCRRCGGTGRLA